MKRTALLLIAASTLVACGDDSPAANGTATDATGQAVGRTMSASVSSAPTRPPRDMAGIAKEAAPTAQFGVVTADEAANQAAASPTDPFQNMNVSSTIVPAMVIRTGQAFIEVEKLDPAVLRIRQIAAQVGGYIANSSTSGGRDQIRQATLELKIPAPKYDEAVGSLSTIGKVETVNSNAQDIGEEFVDVTARVNNAKRLEDRLISLLSNRTGKLDEVLRVERELARVREEIERYEGRLRFLSSRVATSTLTITVHEPSPILGNSPGENPIAAALRRAWKNFVALVAGVIASLGVLIPLALVALAGWTWYRRWKQR
jgi:hypothetical protein